MTRLRDITRRKMQVLLACMISVLIVVVPLACVDEQKDVDYVMWRGDMYVNWQEVKTFEPELFDSLRAGDKLIIGIKYIGDTPWPVVSLFDLSMKSMQGAGKIQIYEGTERVAYSITKDMADYIHENGLAISGEGFNVLSLAVKHSEYSKLDEKALWFGSVVMHDWTQYLDYSRASFRDLQMGDILRFTMSNVTDTAELMFHTGMWGDLPNSRAYLLNDSIYEYVVNSEALEKIQEDGLSVSGVGFTMNRLEVISPLWRGKESLDWRNGDKIFFGPELFKEAKIGDKLVACFDYVGKCSWPQITFMDSTWTDLPGTGRMPVKENMSSITYYITEILLRKLQSQGTMVSGIGFNLRSVAVVHSPTDEYTKSSYWIGNIEMDDQWKAFQNFEPQGLKGLNVGDVLRFSVSRIQPGGYISLRPGDWTSFEGLSVYPLDKKMNHFDFVLNESMVKKIKQSGFIIFGTKYTLTALHIIKRAEAKKQ